VLVDDLPEEGFTPAHRHVLDNGAAVMGCHDEETSD
jgi:hypothetical protein